MNGLPSKYTESPPTLIPLFMPFPCAQNVFSIPQWLANFQKIQGEILYQVFPNGPFRPTLISTYYDTSLFESGLTTVSTFCDTQIWLCNQVSAWGSYRAASWELGQL